MFFVLFACLSFFLTLLPQIPFTRATHVPSSRSFPSPPPPPPLFLESNLHFPSNVDFSLHFNTRLHVCIWDSQVGLSQGGKQLGSEGIGILTWTDETIRNKNDAITLELLSVALSVKTPGLKTVWSQCIGASAVRKTDVRRKTRRPNRGQRPQGSRRRPHLHAG